MSDGVETIRGRVVGNRWALGGTVLYFTEWVAIIAAGGMPTFLGAQSSAGQLAKGYAGRENWFGWAAGWFAVVLLGRIVFVIAVRRSLVHDPDAREGVRILADLGVVTMTVGLVLEVSSYAFVAAAASLGDHGAADGTVRILDVVGGDLNHLLWGPTGVSVLCLGLAMVLDGRFPRVLGWVGVGAGAVLAVGCLAFQAPRLSDASNAVDGLGALFWIWMIWTAVLLWLRTTSTPSARRAPHRVLRTRAR